MSTSLQKQWGGRIWSPISRTRGNKMARTYGGGSIEERNGRYRLVYRVNGRKVTQTLDEGVSKTDAKKTLRDLIGKAEKGEYIDAADMTLNQWLDRWLAVG